MLSDADTVYLTSGLRQTDSQVHAQLSKYAIEAGLRVLTLEGFDNPWARDFLPVQGQFGRVRFRYGYAHDNPQYARLAVPQIPDGITAAVCDIRLDGGNCQCSSRQAVITDIVFQHNPTRTPANILLELEAKLGLEVIVIPCDPDDPVGDPNGVGHSDGVVCFVGDDRMLVHDCRTYSPDYFKRLERILLPRFDIIPMPSAAERLPDLTEAEFRKKYPAADTFNPGYGYYVNLLRAGKLVALPAFGIDEDAQALEVASEAFRGCNVVQIRCEDLAMQGGLLNCVSADYRMRE